MGQNGSGFVLLVKNQPLTSTLRRPLGKSSYHVCYMFPWSWMWVQSCWWSGKVFSAKRRFYYQHKHDDTFHILTNTPSPARRTTFCCCHGNTEASGNGLCSSPHILPPEIRLGPGLGAERWLPLSSPRSNSRAPFTLRLCLAPHWTANRPISFSLPAVWSHLHDNWHAI